MPTYGYRCGDCGHEFEIQQRISDEPLRFCPKCQGKLSKMVYPAGVIFTGSGYYTTDYKNSGKTESTNGAAPKSEDGSHTETATKSESKAEPKSGSKAEGNSEGKSDSKTEKVS
ncbi:MAG: FmdB family zinc ribbon protein [Candidatus Dormibacteraceae bacterium]